MHSRPTLLLLAVAATLSVALVGLDIACEREPVRHSRRLLPESVRGPGVRRVVWRRVGQPPLQLQRSSTDYHLPDDARAVVDQVAVRDLLGTLETMTFVRKRTMDSDDLARFGLAQPTTSVLVQFADDTQVTLHLGARLDAIDRYWVARSRSGGAELGPHAYLVDGHLVRALDLRARDLRQRQIFDLFVDHVQSIEIARGANQLSLVGQPPRVRMRAGPDGLAAADPSAFTALVDQLAELAIARFMDPGDDAVTAARGTQTTLHIAVENRGRKLALRDLGPCPDDPASRLVDATIGVGCVRADALSSLERHLDATRALLAQTPLAGIRPLEMTLAQPGAPVARLRATGTSWAWQDAGDGPALEVTAVDQWLQLLERASTGRYLLEHELTAQGYQLGPSLLVVETRHPDQSRHRIELFASAQAWLVRRDREPGYLVLDRPEPTRALLPATPMRFQRRALLRREPFALREASASGVDGRDEVLLRGALLDDWQVVRPTGRRLRAGVIDDLRELGRLRARAFVADTPTAAHGLRSPRARVRLRFDAGLMDEREHQHEIELGRPLEDGCYARLDGTGPVFTLDRQTCAVLAGPWTE